MTIDVRFGCFVPVMKFRFGNNTTSSLASPSSRSVPKREAFFITEFSLEETDIATKDSSELSFWKVGC